jgi:hypothetical protein
MTADHPRTNFTSVCLLSVLKLVSGRAMYRRKASSQATFKSFALYGLTLTSSGDSVRGGGGAGARNGEVGGSGEAMLRLLGGILGKGRGHVESKI